MQQTGCCLAPSSWSSAPAAGAVMGMIGGRVLLWAKDNDMTSDTYEGVGAMALAICAYLGADMIGGNGFIAAFVAGLCFGDLVEKRCKFIFEFTESEGQGLTWMAFLLIGLVLVPPCPAASGFENAGAHSRQSSDCTPAGDLAFADPH